MQSTRKSQFYTKFSLDLFCFHLLIFFLIFFPLLSFNSVTFLSSCCSLLHVYIKIQAKTRRIGEEKNQHENLLIRARATQTLIFHFLIGLDVDVDIDVKMEVWVMTSPRLRANFPPCYRPLCQTCQLFVTPPGRQDRLLYLAYRLGESCSPF